MYLVPGKDVLCNLASTTGMNGLNLMYLVPGKDVLCNLVFATDMNRLNLCVSRARNVHIEMYTHLLGVKWKCSGLVS